METSQVYQEQKFGQRSPQKHQIEKQINQISFQEEEIQKLVEIIPKTQICYEKVVLTDSYAVILTFHSFTIKFGNFIRNLNFEETTQLMHLESIDIITKYICENLQLNQNENININIGQHQDQFQKFSIPSTPITVSLEDLGIIEIQYPRLQAYFQDSGQCENIYLTNTDVLHLIGNKFSTIQQYDQFWKIENLHQIILQFEDQRNRD
ncbi:unnamed protein product (macronuclear) [Paramecium tetraurelia]|uniref:Uncharacterized protein n=1 Tax=Paramecium tetraurelia TaxID=5888 RepID=A0DPP9_PARTE|nr:uncharacterized protein GSPATT00019198001 [Paramecium tetraurelia]CAK85016.1 unnamed protein product [Paramecium tetraurelia]|eukprot:XP_001452413.1 hypothetical protein (macronuclear) [Paramecium tetraurelia strain d4-2]